VTFSSGRVSLWDSISRRSICIFFIHNTFLFPAGVHFDIARPIKFLLSQERLNHFKDLQGSVSEHIISSSSVISLETPEEDQITLRKIVHFISSFSSKVHLTVNQVVVVVVEEPPGLPKAAITASITGFDFRFAAYDAAYSRTPFTPDRTEIDFSVDTLVLTTLIGDRYTRLNYLIQNKPC